MEAVGPQRLWTSGVSSVLHPALPSAASLCSRQMKESPWVPGSNRTERVLLLDRFFYNREEFVRFDSDLGEYRAKDFLEQKRVEVDSVCRLNYGVLDTFLVPRQTEPRVTVYPAKTQPLQHHNLLVCSVTGFYPGHVEVRWFRNGQEEAAGVVSTGLIPNGDWTFQTMVMLETVPQSGEVYSCRVEHPSLTSPVTVEWRVWSENAQNKKLSGLGGFVLGILFLAVGLFFCFRSQKGEGPQKRQPPNGKMGKRPE
uniref:Ig-like domain-containing protein n=1 Tax=Sus scrofa TaxID=9823 RepID=A0A4X1UXY4_PIG